MTNSKTYVIIVEVFRPNRCTFSSTPRLRKEEDMEMLLSTPDYYLVAGAIGLIGLVLGIVLGDLLDAIGLTFDGIDGWISSHAIFTGLTVFGGAGVLLYHVMPEIPALLIALSGSTASFVAIAQVVRWMHKQQSDSLVSRTSYYASLATVTAPIGANGSLGEVETKSANGARVRLSAHTNTDCSLTVGERVIIKRVEPGHVFVIPLDDPTEEK